VRAGGEAARATDERIALNHGVLGQETTGAGGFAMALRSIPAVAAYAERMIRVCPDAWLLNFTNPAGLVVQALTSRYPHLKIAGICDTPTTLRRDVAAAFGRRSDDVDVRVYGLNHLSWMPQAIVDGEDLVGRLLADDRRLHSIRELALFETSLLRLLGMLPNEYLYYYYYRDRAVANIRAAGETRGEQVLRLSAGLIERLAALGTAERPLQALAVYRRYLARRHGTYMAVESGHPADESGAVAGPAENGDEGEGYAGVALDILEAARRPGATVVANVPNQGALPDMRDDDVVEVSCGCDAAGIHPIRQDDVNEDALLLTRQVKRYERLTVEAITHRSRELASEALLAHPLIGSFPVACSLVDAYLDAHRELVGEWE
jgi:6-phospho-beta-glucosidase